MRKFHIMIFWLCVFFVVYMLVITISGCRSISPNPNYPENRRPTSADLCRYLNEEGVKC